IKFTFSRVKLRHGSLDRGNTARWSIRPMMRANRVNDEPVPGYRLIELLGKGGFGEVWKARAPGGAECALKIIKLDNKQGFKEFGAIRLFRQIRPPTLVPLNAIFLKDDLGGLIEDSAANDSLFLQGRASELLIAMGLGDKSLTNRLQECKQEGLPGIPIAELI